MAVIWVVQQPKPDLGMAERLIGDHAVRIFGSLKSLTTLSRCAQRAAVDLVIVDESQVVDGWHVVRDLISRSVGEVPIAFAHGAPMRPAWQEAPVVGCYALSLAVDPLELNRIIDAIVRSQHKLGSSKLRFKDVVLDWEGPTLSLGLGDSTNLTQKEAKLLGFFMERAGCLLSREEIRSGVWRGVKVSSRTIDSCVSRLRSRLTDTEVTIESRYGDGYIFR